jgi:hypothetical protein
LEEAMKDMDSNTAPGPDELSVSFYKELWSEVKHTMLEMLGTYIEGH